MISVTFLSLLAYELYLIPLQFYHQHLIFDKWLPTLERYNKCWSWIINALMCVHLKVDVLKADITTI